MRGSHGKYIYLVNEQYPSWHVNVSPGLWRTAFYIEFDTIVGKYGIAEGILTDLFTVVPDTGYYRFQKASLLHDCMRRDTKTQRHVADVCFFFEMLAAVRDIREALMKTDCPQDVIDAEVARLSRVACLYMLGVNSWIGTLYLKFDKYF